MARTKRDGLFKRGRIWWIRTDPIDGVQRSTRCTDYEAADLWRKQRERAAADPAYAAATRATIGEWIGRYVASNKQSWSEATTGIVSCKLGHWIRIFGEGATLSVMTPDTFDRFVKQRREEGVSDQTVSKEVALMVATLKLAKRSKQFTGELDVLKPPDLHAGYTPRKRALTRPELAALLAELLPHRGALVAVCVALGCRFGEAMRLLPTDIEADRVLIRGTKTAGSRRYVPILSVYRPLLERALPYLPLAPWPGLGKDLTRACKRAGIERCSPNDWRRTHSTLLIEAGVDRDVVRRLLGHTTTNMVDRVYGQPTVRALGELAESRVAGAEPLHLSQLRNTRLDSKELSAEPEPDSESAPGICYPNNTEQKPRDPERFLGEMRGNQGEEEAGNRSKETPTQQSIRIQTAAGELLVVADQNCPGDVAGYLLGFDSPGDSQTHGTTDGQSGAGGTATSRHVPSAGQQGSDSERSLTADQLETSVDAKAPSRVYKAHCPAGVISSPALRAFRAQAWIWFQGRAA